MFKFMKSKKGFTLVELMIVVVIMAILVAVAVPIYSAVTANAKAKTCKGNQREIISQITNTAMTDSTILKSSLSGSAKFTVKTNSAGDKFDTAAGETNVFATAGKFASLFNSSNIPYCPVENGEIVVTVTKTADSVSVETNCTGGNGKHTNG